ncbi:TRAP transporter small permease [Devosia alba]|uniref:TRAP transporter small permease n=1 Tax=Devosia alba TaxID=3152360 RepID=UPI0032646F2F
MRRQSGEEMNSVFKHMGSAHDALTKAGFVLAQLCLLTIVLSYSYEIVARYFFNAPTWWSNEIVAYALCIGTFLTLPEVTRTKGHIAIDFVIGILGPKSRRTTNIAIALCSAITCLILAWLFLQANIAQFQRGEMMVRVKPIPKVWLSVWLTYGFASAGLHFLRHCFTTDQEPESGIV